MPRMGIGKKGLVYDDPCTDCLMRMSKAALADCVVDLLRGLSDGCDDPVTEEAAIERLKPVLTMRGDRLPCTKETIRLRKRKAAFIFNKAIQIAEKDDAPSK